MTRVVVEVYPDLDAGSGLLIQLSEPRTNDGRVPRRFAYDPQHPVPAGFAAGQAATRDMGAYLADGLRCNPGVSRELDNLRLLAPNAPANPLYIQVTADAEAAPWETLFDQDVFLALDQRWPVARIGAESVGAPSVNFEPPLRVMAILGAANVPAAEEWDALFDACRRATFPVHINTLVAEDSVADRVRASTDPNLTIDVGFVPPAIDVLSEIADFRPNVLHFFSHGRINHGFPEIQVATRSSWVNDDDPGHVVLEPKQFATLTSLQAPWVLTMNVCRGAQATDTGSLAYSLQAVGFPAVASMREPVSETVAHAFTKGFYRSLMRLLGQAVVGGPAVDIDLAKALYEPRMEICAGLGLGPSCRDALPVQREWTLPVLYVRPSGLVVERRDPAPAPIAGQPAVATAEAEDARTALKTKLRVLKDLMAANLPGVDEEAAASITAEIQRIESELFA